jgi:hypothetical protein
LIRAQRHRICASSSGPAVPPIELTKTVKSAMATKSPIDPELVREMAQLINETDLTEIEVQKGDLRIRVARTITATVMAPVAAAPAFAPAPVATAAPAAAPADAKAAAAHPGTVKSPMVGTAYRGPEPECSVIHRDRHSVGDPGRDAAAHRSHEDLEPHRPRHAPAVVKEILDRERSARRIRRAPAGDQSSSIRASKSSRCSTRF